MEVFDVVEVFAVDLKDHVAGLNAGAVGGRSAEDLLHGHAAVAVIADLVLHAGAEVGHVDAEEAGVGALVRAGVLLERRHDRS